MTSDPPSLDKRTLLHYLNELVRAKPADMNQGVTNPPNQEWTGQARALIGMWNPARAPAFADDLDVLFQHERAAWNAKQSAYARIMHVIEEARSELRIVAGGQVAAAFNAGQSFDMFDKLRRVIETAQRDVLFVDRYMGADFVSMYLPHVPQWVRARLLTRDYVPQLTSALAVFKGQHSTTVEVRTSQDFHGRFLCVDGGQAILVDASFKDAARAAPAVIMELTADITAASISQYEALWKAGTPVP